jgi:hypothetical protein
MKKLTISALIASTLFITACDQAEDVTEGAMDKASEMTHSAAEAGKDMVDKAAGMAKDTMDGMTGHEVGGEHQVKSVTDEYHEKMKAHQ